MWWLCVWHFEKLPNCFPKLLYHFTFPPRMNEVSGFSSSLPAHYLLSIFLIIAILWVWSKSFSYKTFLNIKIEKTVLWHLLYLSSSFDNYQHLFNFLSDFLKVALIGGILRYSWGMYRKLYIFQVYNLIGLKHTYWWNDHHS